jgi:ribosomal protein L16/L10AE
VLFEMEGVSESEAREALQLAAAKLPILTKFSTRFAQEKMQ